MVLTEIPQRDVLSWQSLDEGEAVNMLQNGWILFSGGELESLDHILVALNVKLKC